MLRSHKLFIFLVLSLQLLIKLPNFDEFVLPSLFTALILHHWLVNLDFFCVDSGLFLFFLFKTFNQLILVGVLVLNMFFKLAKLVHQSGDLGNPIIVEEHS